MVKTNSHLQSFIIINKISEAGAIKGNEDFYCFEKIQVKVLTKFIEQNLQEMKILFYHI